MRTTPIGKDLATSHWGAYDVVRKGAEVVGLAPRADDPEPSPIGAAMWDAYRSPLRIQRPAVRKGWLQRSGAGNGGPGRGKEPFVEVGWEHALDLVAGELQRVIARHGNSAIFGGSYGWSSAGRFHHARTQVRRFLLSGGGCTDSAGNYSWGAAQFLLPHVIGTP